MIDAISNLVATAILIAAIYGLVFWANRARTDRSAIVGIYLLFGLPGGLLTVAGTALVINTDLGEGPFILGSGIAFLVPLIKPLRKLIARFTPMDPNSPIDLCGLALILWVSTFFTISAIQSGPVDVDSEGGGQLLESSFWLLLNALTFVGIAYVAVGYRIYRTGQEATKRLGLEWPDLKTILISLAMVIPCYIVAIIGNALTLIFQPDVFDNLQDTMDDMTTGLDNPIGMILIGLSAGIGEEVLFRGAIQPRFGIVIAALFWTTMHAQYDVSFVLVGLFGVGIVLGLQRKYFGTASAIITHAVYNMIAVAITIAGGHILWF
ncbi:MAG TPA: CPBP family intramembrane glutamic endopeptidase [Thermomicrobiales bacterium]|nr:CPBP family intramembrane glutamic endopeptidase [Thermomicrobiales bacterium]